MVCTESFLVVAATYIIKIMEFMGMGHYNLLEMIRYKPLEMIGTNIKRTVIAFG